MKLVLIIGAGAVGKMSVGQELMKITNLRLFHNHMMIEPVVDIFAENKLFLEKLEKEKQQLKSNEQKVEQNTLTSLKEIRYIGQALNCYLIFEDGNDLYFADQHAAHERILFDKLCDGVKNMQIEFFTN